MPKERVEDVIYFNPGDLEKPVDLTYLNGTLKTKGLPCGNQLRCFIAFTTLVIQVLLAHALNIFRNCALLLMADP